MLGFMSSGKSAVGSALARRLEWDYLDFDAEIEIREGQPVSVLVDAGGEEYLRNLERGLTHEVRDTGRLVLAPGGGWILQNDLIDVLRPGTLFVWLRSSPVEIVRRLRADADPKPLANRPHAIEAVSAMLRDREPLFREADLSVPTDRRSIQSVAFEIEQIIRSRNGDSWPG